MAKQKKSSLLGKLSNTLRTAFDAHKNDETELGTFGDLPPGISNGIAQLVECKFDTYKTGDNEGKLFFYAAGVVIVPKVHAGIPIEGLRTSIMEPLCDTPSRKRDTATKHLAWILNELRKLGVDTSAMDIDDLETTVEALKEAQPYFRFDTWIGKPSKEYPDPKTNHRWNGCVDYTPEDGEEVEDNTDIEEEEQEEEQEEEKPAKKVAKKEEAKPAKKVKKPEPEFDDQGDIDTLLKRANKGDEDAQNRLSELAIAKGYSEEEVEQADSWAVVKEMAVTPKEEESEEEETDEEDNSEEEGNDPNEGEVWNYIPAGQKKPVECEVVEVNSKKKTVKLKNLTNPKTVYKDIPFSKLTSN